MKKACGYLSRANFGLLKSLSETSGVNKLLAKSKKAAAPARFSQSDFGSAI
jgi:hypothetical protein